MGYYLNVEENVRIYIEDLNEKGKETIVFLHGWPGDHNLFEYQFNCLAQKDYRCIGIDQRGFGKSDKPIDGYDYNRLSDDIKCIVDKLELKDFTLLGHSTGGAIAIRYMARHKACGVKKLILCGAAAPSLIRRPYFPYGIKKEVVDHIIEGTYKDRPKMLSDFGKIFFYTKVSRPLMDWFFGLGLKAAGWSTASIAKTWLGEEELFDDIKEIETETLIIHGIHDKVCLFALGEWQARRIKNSRLSKFMDSGHATFYDERDKFNKEIASFIDGKS